MGRIEMTQRKKLRGEPHSTEIEVENLIGCFPPAKLREKYEAEERELKEALKKWLEVSD
jgi:hypothetical protein